MPKVRMLPELKRRIRWITREEADRLLAELPEHIRAMAQFLLATGLREANVTSLEWSQVDLENRRAWIHADQAKGRRAIAVPLNAQAVVVLRRLQGNHPTRVFTFRGQPVKKAGTKAWRAATDHLTEYADRLCTLRIVDGVDTNLAQACNEKGAA